MTEKLIASQAKFLIIGTNSFLRLLGNEYLSAIMGS